MAEDFKLKKKYGQNFIKDVNIIHKIVDKADVTDDTLVIEVGPGMGVLTKELSNRAKHVVSYEIDKTLKPILSLELSGYKNVDVIYNDFLECNVKEDLNKYEYKKLYMVANLPYYITTPIITKMIDDEIDVDKIVVMVQKEVGERFAAKTCSKSYNSLTVFLNYYFDIKKLFDVSRTVFTPVPNVDSAIIELSKKENRLFLKDKDLFFRLVKESFMHKRKNIKNNLKNYDLQIVDLVLKEHGLDLNARAEQMSLEIFVEISNRL